MEIHRFTVPNISCNHCVNSIKNELSDLSGVTKVEGDADQKVITVEWQEPATMEKIRDALQEINYPAQ
jgi:copper chaperone CopZ